jgi:protein-S-isoprenylcysteine O-methyltransferase Ste14
VIIGAHFAKHRIAWSRVIAVIVLCLVLFGSPPKALAGWPAVLSELLGYALLVAATLWRIWCALFIGGIKDGDLALTGPYSMVRNPLYVGNFLGAAGLGFAVQLPHLAALLAVGFALLYPAVVAREEAKLLELFGERYRQYCATVPRWLPDFSLYHEPELVTVSPRHVRKGILDAMWFLWAFALWELIEQLHATAILPTFF